MKYYYSLFLCILFTTVGCKKYLDEKPNKSLIVPTTVADFQKLLDDYPIMNNQNTPSFGEASSDDYFLSEAVYNSLLVRDRSVYIWEPFDYNYGPADWPISYRSIYNANLCIEGIEKITESAVNASARNNVKGSALFFRAYNFLNLAWSHSKVYNESSASTDLGVALRLTSDFNVPSVRASVKETYDRIILDAESAATLLPDNSVHSYRPSKAAAYGLLARIYLSMGKYELALKNAELSLMIKSQLLNFNDPNDVNVAANVPFKQFNPEVLFYTEMNPQTTLYISYQAFVDTVLYASYNSNDLRKAAYFKPRTGYQEYKGSYTSSSFTVFTGIATDEITLIKAECNARLGNTDKALTDLNLLMIKRWNKNVTYVPITAVDAKDALKKVLIERRKELVYRGLRWIDIKRFNAEGETITLKRKIGDKIYTLAPNSKYYALPLPRDIIEQTGMPQNPL